MEEPLKIGYCVSHDFRDLQIKSNTARVKERVTPHLEKRTDPIALVNFGPSLNDTWEEIKKFKYVLTCSGAHKFLVDRGIIPTWHIDVDPREHKIKLIGQPQKETEYLIASTCSPKLIEHLSGYNVKLWHIFDTSEDGLRLLPHGEHALTGGCSAGVRTLTMARFLGFTDLHVFGMDGNQSEKYGKHAAEHPNQPKDSYKLEYDGKEYITTPAMLEPAKNTFHELDMMPDVTVKFYGEGLVQHLARNYVRKNDKKGFVSFSKPTLISSDYCELNKKLHADDICYGIGGGRHAETVIKLVEKLKTDECPVLSVLDFGCGKGMLAKALPWPIWEFDPCIPGKEEPPRPADLVVCSDVLEHIEPDKLEYVLSDLKRCVKRVGYFIINMAPSKKFLADGRNAHLIQKDAEWWRAELSKYFIVASDAMIVRAPMIHVIVAARQKVKKAVVAKAVASVKQTAPA